MKEENSLCFENGGNRPLILVVEDNPVIQKLFSVILDSLMLSSIVAAGGADALEKARAIPADIVFMDIQMPGMNGYETARLLRERGYIKPIVAVTASGFSGERELCLGAGMDDILLKPFTRSDIEGMLEKWINVPKRSPRGETRNSAEIPSRDKGQEVPARETEVFNTSEITESFFANRELIVTLLSRFVLRAGAQIDGIPELVKAGDWDSARREAHSIRGAAMTMGGRELGAAAARVEAACLDRNAAGIDAAFLLLKDAFPRFKKEADVFVRERS